MSPNGAEFWKVDINRRELLKRGAVGVGGLAAAGALAACGSSSTSSGGSSTSGSAGPSSSGTPVKGGTLTVGALSAGIVETIDPRKTLNSCDLIRAYNLYDTLFKAASGGVVPGLATSAEPNADATVWTLKLRDGVTFHNGKPFTADDVVFNIQQVWSSKQSYQQASTVALIDVPKVKKVDRLTVEVPLQRPCSAFPGFTSYGNVFIVPAGTTDFGTGIGTGPFKYVSFNPGKSSTFAANHDYWGGAPYVEELVVNSSFTDDPSRLNAVIGGQVDIAPQVPPALAKASASNASVVLGNAPGPAFLTVCMRINVPPFNDPRVVQAMKLLTDREAILNDVYAGYGVIGNDSPGAGFKFWASDIKPEHDPEKAKSLLKAAGQEDLSLPLYTSAVIPGMLELATAWSAQAAEVGVHAPVKQLSTATYFTTTPPAYASDERNLSINPWNVLPMELGVFYLTALNADATYPETGWGQLPGQDKLVNAALAETNPDKAGPLWHAVQEQQVKEGGYMIPVNYNFLDAYGTKVRGVETNSAGPCGNFDFSKGWLSA